jgi:hypothetical protein
MKPVEASRLAITSQLTGSRCRRLRRVKSRPNAQDAMTRTTLAIVAIVLASTLAPAHALPSREWLDACQSPDLGQQALCAIYANGVFDAMMFLQVTEPRTPAGARRLPAPQRLQGRVAMPVAWAV